MKTNLRNEISAMIGIELSEPVSNIKYKVLESTQENGYTRQLIEYDSYGDKVSAFLLLPEILDNNPAILINHQHNREHHLGKVRHGDCLSFPATAINIQKMLLILSKKLVKYIRNQMLCVICSISNIRAVTN